MARSRCACVIDIGASRLGRGASRWAWSPATPAAASKPVSARRASPPANRTNAVNASGSMPNAPSRPRASDSALITTSMRSASDNGTRATMTDRESSGAMTAKLGFSVVAATRITVRSSTPGSSASCCALLKRWISSRNNTVCRPNRSRSRAACAITSRTSFTPAVTADNSTKRRPDAPATRCANVVFPVPGGPQRIADSGPAGPPDPSTRRRNGLPTLSTDSWPRTSARVRGRIRTARGESERPYAVPPGPAPRSPSARAAANRSPDDVTTSPLFRC